VNAVSDEGGDHRGWRLKQLKPSDVIAALDLTLKREGCWLSFDEPLNGCVESAQTILRPLESPDIAGDIR
jgi:hypothetical protein